MKRGRELDTLIAQEVFSHTVYIKKHLLYEKTPTGDRPLRNYSKDIQWAWEVAEKMGVSLIPVENGQWFAFVGPYGAWKSPAEFITFLQTGEFVNVGAAVTHSAANAICVAVSKAIEVRKHAEPKQEVTDVS